MMLFLLGKKTVKLIIAFNGKKAYFMLENMLAHYNLLEYKKLTLEVRINWKGRFQKIDYQPNYIRNNLVGRLKHLLRQKRT